MTLSERLLVAADEMESAANRCIASGLPQILREAAAMCRDAERLRDKAEEAMFSALHEAFAVCGHCGKRSCPLRKSNSRLPDEIFKPVRAAIDAALAAEGKP